MRVLDAKGSELRAGDRVKSPRGDGKVVRVAAAGAPTRSRVLIRRENAHSIIAWADETGRCNDLIRVDSNESPKRKEAASTAAPERNS